MLRLRALLAAAAALLLVPTAAAADPTFTTLSASGAHARAPSIAGDGAGRAVVAWRALVDGAWVAQAAVRPAGGAFREAETISAGGADVDQVRVALDASATATAVWQRGGASGVAIEASTRGPGGAWSAPETISPAGVRAVDPVVVASPGGDVVALWLRLDGGTTTLQAALRPAGGGWQPAETISAPGALEPSLAIGAGGDVAVVWRQPDGPFTLATAAVRPRGGPWGAPEPLSAPGRSAGSPDVAVDGQGGVVAVWTRAEGGQPVVQWAARPSVGAWSQPRDLSQPGRRALQPTVVVLPSGDATVAWVRAQSLEVASRPAGSTTWSTPIELVSYGKPTAPRLAVDADGSATLVWTRWGDIVASYRTAGGDWQDPFALVASFDAEAYAPQLIVDGGQRATAVYALNRQRDEVAVAAAYDSTTGLVEAPVCDPEVDVCDDACDPDVEDCTGTTCDPDLEDCVEQRLVAGPAPVALLRPDGRVELTVVCPARPGCRGAVALQARPGGRAAALGAAPVALGAARYVAHGRVVHVRLRVSPWQQRLLRGDGPARLVAVVRMQRWTGRPTTVVRSVTLVERRRRALRVPPRG
ncbi:MAG: hypothetical protein R3C15_15040 [Thermoleophilia bacterium]